MVIAGATQKELARHVRYLKIENQILRSKLPKRVSVTPQERKRLTRYARNLGSALNELATIVHPDTIRRWIRESKKGRKPAKVGRRRTAADIEKLILKLAKGNAWGYTRILGELRKLQIKSVSRNTVKNILIRNGFDPGPQRGVGTWDEFLKLHAKTLWQCDFFSKRVLTSKGFRDLFVLVFLHVESRRVFITPSTFKPNEAWMLKEAAAFRQYVKATGLKAKIVMHDRDGKFMPEFDAVLKESGARIVRTAVRAPNQNAFVERWIQSIKQEALDHFIVFGEDHFNYLISEYVEHYLTERPHQGLGNQLIAANLGKGGTGQVSDKPPDEPIHCRERLGGLLKDYYRAAA